MLAPSDALLIERDPSVPALKLLLDDEALRAVLADHLPQMELVGTHTEYLRYKPGVSCLARIRLQTATHVSSAYAVAYHRHAHDKLLKAAMVCDSASTTPIRIHDHSIVVFPFPLDRRLPALRRFVNPSSLDELLRRAAPQLLEKAGSENVQFTTLRYKPERRFVAQVAVGGRPLAVLKIYSDTAYALARRAAKTICGSAGLSHARCIGHSDRHATLLFRWIDGPLLSELSTDVAQAEQLFCQAAGVLRSLHARRGQKLHLEPMTAIVRRLRDTEAVLKWIDERSAADVRTICDLLAQRLLEEDEFRPAVIHGDLHLKQFVVGPDGPKLLDFDRARRADPAEDLGSLCANLRRRAINSAGEKSIDRLFDCFLREYAARGGEVDLDRIHLYAAIRLMELAVEPFRTRHRDWLAHTQRFIAAAQQLLAGVSSGNVAPAPAVAVRDTPSATIDDPFDVARDESLSSIREAIQTRIAQRRLRQVFVENGEHSSIELESVRVLRHKPGRHCLIEYRFRLASTGARVTLLGKMHAKSRHEQSFARQQALWSAGFDAESVDGICVARPFGVIAEWNMWLQCAVPGEVSWHALDGPLAPQVARRIAEAAHKLHRANIPTTEAHRLSDELAILAECLPCVAGELPDLRDRVQHALEACQELAATIEPVSPVGIHRDFYPGQVLIDGDRLYVVDHDWVTSGDPRLDIGNFVGHLMERSIRKMGHPNLYESAAAAMVDRYVELDGGGESCRDAIKAYAILTLARHVYISRRFSDRHLATLPLLDWALRLSQAQLRPSFLQSETGTNSDNSFVS